MADSRTLLSYAVKQKWRIRLQISPITGRAEPWLRRFPSFNSEQKYLKCKEFLRWTESSTAHNGLGMKVAVVRFEAPLQPSFGLKRATGCPGCSP